MIVLATLSLSHCCDKRDLVNHSMAVMLNP